MTASLRLCDQSRARGKREPVEFSFHDFDFLFVVSESAFSIWPNEDRLRRGEFRL